MLLVLSPFRPRDTQCLCVRSLAQTYKSHLFRLQLTSDLHPITQHLHVHNMSEPPKVVTTGMTESRVEEWLDRVDESAPVEKRPTPPPEYGPLYEGWEEEAERREKEEFRDSSPGSFSTPSIESERGVYYENPYSPDPFRMHRYFKDGSDASSEDLWARYEDDEPEEGSDISDAEKEILESIRRLFRVVEDDDGSTGSWYTPTSGDTDWLPVDDRFLIDLFRHPVLYSISSMESLPPPEYPHLYPTRQAYERMIDLSFLQYVITSLFALVVVLLIEVVEIDRRIADLLPDWWPGHEEE